MKGDPEYRFSDGELQWVSRNLDSTLAWARGERVMQLTLVITFALGLVVHLAGYALGAGGIRLPAGWPVELVADLLGNLGIVLWTSVVLVVFLQVIPRRGQRNAERYARAAIEALRARGEDVPAVIGDADPVQSKLDAILARLTAVESAMQRGEGPGA